MTKKNAMKWVNALRSGEFKQTKYRLKNENKEYCCLGVLCEINKVKSIYKDEQKSYLFGSDICILDTKIQMKTDISSDNGILSCGTKSLAELNDDDYTFDEIADIIQICYEEL